MTKQQEIRVQQIKSYIEKWDMYGNNSDYEFKEFSVKEEDYGAVSIYSVTGRKNDEGTAGAILCRNERQIFIGKRGGLRSYSYDSKKKKTINLRGWFDVMTYGMEH